VVSLFTCGLFLPVWFLIALTPESYKREKLTIDEYGNQVVTDLTKSSPSIKLVLGIATLIWIVLAIYIGTSWASFVHSQQPPAP